MSFNSGRFEFNWVMLIPILGWLFIGIGLIWPFQHWAWQTLWWIDVFFSVVVHGVQIFVALPIASSQGFSTVQTIVYTFVFGATWWKPLQTIPKA